MGLLQKLRLKLFGRKRRQLERDAIQKFIQIKIIIDGHKYDVSDFSSEGFALKNEIKTPFEVDARHTGNLTLRGEPRLTIKVRVARVVDTLVGFEVLDKDVFKRFVESNLRLEKK